MNLVNLETFIRVAELGSLAAAARTLRVPKSTVGRRVESLEAELGLGLLTRSSRQMTLTDDGRALKERCAGPLRELEDVNRVLGDQTTRPRGKLVVSMASDSGSSLPLELACGFARENPDVQLEIRTPHLRLEAQPQLEEGVDVLIDVVPDAIARPLGPATEGWMQCKLTSLRAHLFASPEYLEEMGVPQSLEDLTAHRLVAFAKEPYDQVWQLHDNTGRVEDLPLKPRFLSLYPSVLLGFLLSGNALGLCPPHTSTRHEQQGSLIRVLPSWSTELLQMRLIWLQTRHLAPRIRAFIDYIQAEFPKAPWLE